MDLTPTPVQIVDVLEARYTATPGFIDLLVTIEGPEAAIRNAVGDNPTLRTNGEAFRADLAYTWKVAEEYDNGWNVAAWFADHPDFEIAEYVAAPVVLTKDHVWREKDRRLALGFDFDFGDGRGVHRIGTTTADMVGWDEVSKLAAALLATGGGATPITISTDTGVTQVTALEWQGVMLAAAAFRQPIWGASFILASMDPIPADYASNEAYWP